MEKADNLLLFVMIHKFGVRVCRNWSCVR